MSKASGAEGDEPVSPPHPNRWERMIESLSPIGALAAKGRDLLAKVFPFRVGSPSTRLEVGDLAGLGIEQLLAIYETFRSYARHEDNLVNNRVTWMLTIHGFLYATYGLALQGKVALFEKLKLEEMETFWGLAGLGITVAQLDGLLVLIPLVGSCISFLAWNSIRAAKNAVFTVERIFREQFREASGWGVNVSVLKGDHGSVVVPGIGGGGRPFAKAFGHSASVIIPWVLIGSWVLALSQASLPMGWSNSIGHTLEWLRYWLSIPLQLLGFASEFLWALLQWLRPPERHYL